MSNSLLPKSHEEFSEKNYWEKFFKKWGPKAFEWYGEYNSLCGLLHKYVKTTDSILVIGCGNSSLSADMYDVGYKHQINIDISDVAIKQMTEKNREVRPELLFVKMDMLKMTYSDGQFSVVLDKGTLDAIMTDTSEATISTVEKMFVEIGRVLKVGGRYICVSLAQEHILKKIVHYFCNEGWMVRVCRVSDVDSEEGRDFHMPVFMFVCTKMKMKMPKPILEVTLFEEAQPTRYGSEDELIAAINEVQQYGLVRSRLNKGSQDTQLSIDLFDSKSSTPRYTLHVVDTPRTNNRRNMNAFAIFIVPEGRETEWIFCSDDGRRNLADSAGFGRLIVATLHRDHKYGGLEEVKTELSSKVMELAPDGVGNAQVPFLSVGDDINSRQILYRDSSELSGELIVEDVQCDQQIYRRLVFLSNRNVVQSEALMLKVKRKKGKKHLEQLVVDTNKLGCTYYNVMVAGLVFLEDFQQTIESSPKLLLLGLGGGGLPLFMHQHFKSIHIEVVEIDKTVAKVAEDWFDFKTDERLKVTVADALDVVKREVEKESLHEIVILDIDSKDMSLGMSCPPTAFIEEAFLKLVEKILHPKGVFMINLVSRNRQLRETVLATIKSVFPIIYVKKVPEDVNEILFALSPHRKTLPDLSQTTLPTEFTDGLKMLQDCVRKNQKGAVSSGRNSELFSLVTKLDELSLL